MKTMRRGNYVTRVPEDQVKKYLKERWKFCPKSVWKNYQKNLPNIQSPNA